MNLQAILDVATSSNATTLGLAESTNNFRKAVENAIIIHENMKIDDRNYLTRTSTVPLVFTGTKSITHDHVVLAAMRSAIRQVYEKTFHIQHTAERACIIGSAAREIKMYDSNKNIHHWVPGFENKDYDRVIRPILNEILLSLRKKAKKTDYRINLETELKLDTTKVRPAVKRYFDSKAIFDDYCLLKKLPANIHVDKPPQCNTLCFEDSVYNYDVDSLTKLFDQTGAQTAYGYALMPWELVFPDMPENHIYRFSRDTVHGHATLTFRGGYSNGYTHVMSNWSTIMKNIVLKGYNGVQLGIEIVARVGCMAAFKIYRCFKPEILTRTLELPSNECFVRVLDIWGSVDHHTCRFNTKLNYFTVNENEYFDTLNYMLGMDEKSVSIANTMVFIRRKMSGTFVANKELASPWSLSRKDTYRLAVALTLDCMIKRKKMNDVYEHADPYEAGIYAKIKKAVRKAGKWFCLPIQWLLDWIFEENLTDKIMLFPKHMCMEEQQGKINAKIIPKERWNIPGVDNRERVEDKFVLDLYSAFDNKEDVPECPFCLDMMGRLGKQIISCEHREDTFIEISLTDDEVHKFKTQLMDDDHDPPGLKAVKSAAKECCPLTGFKHRVKIHYIFGGPGTGKSYIIKELADPHKDLVFAPFTKLKTDYMGVEQDDGTVADLNFKTQHRAMTTKGHKRIFVDEFTSISYEFLACVIYLNQAEEVYLFGDHKQTKVMAEEGIYIGDRIQLDKISKHELMVNFRNAKDVVALLNRHFDYKMIANSPIMHSIEVVAPGHSFVDQNGNPKDPDCRMAFTHNSAKHWTDDEKNTIRANQGGTFNRCVLYATAMDGDTTQVDPLIIVGISRHKEKLYIVSDESTPSKKFLARLDISEDFKEHLQEFLHIPKDDIKMIVLDDPDVDKVLKSDEGLEHPPSDAYKLLSTLLPNVATDKDYVALNDHASQVVPDTFKTANIDTTELVAPLNPRGHPQALEKTYFTMGPGVGSAFVDYKPAQTLSVFAQRYDNPKPKKPFDHESQVFAKEVVYKYFKENKNVPSGRTFEDFLNDVHISEMANKYIQDVQAKHYYSQYKGMPADDYDLRTIRFHLKAIFKPDSTSKDLDFYKAGQGISAWSPSALSWFCFAMRVIAEWDRQTEKCDADHIVMTDNGISTEVFLNDVNALFGGIRTNAHKYGILDAKMFDSNQNQWTQFIEMTYLRYLGVSDEFIITYFFLRSNSPMLAKAISIWSGFEKTSGEPGTLFLNGVVMKVLGNAMLKGQGPCMILYKGDDFLKYQANLVVDMFIKGQIMNYTSLQLTCDIKKSGEFCGMTISDEGIMPNIQRKLNKLAGQKFRDYKHFCEYQKSIRDNIQLMKAIGITNVLAGTVENSGCSFEEATLMFHCLDSWSHINREQWEKEMGDKVRDEATFAKIDINNNNASGVVFNV